jgi:epoxyqueuosine reductase
MTPQEKTHAIKQYALETLGFSACGIAKVMPIEAHKEKFTTFLQKGYHGEMTYLENNFEKRFNPQLLVDDSKSVIVVLLNYYPQQRQPKDVPQIAKYAYGKDYHKVVKKKLKRLFTFIQKEIDASVQGRFFSDSAPVLERYWAQEAGLGWIGKNGLLINQSLGSYFFIGELLINLELDYHSAIQPNHCGTCTKCIDACPTKALVAPYQLIAKDCIAYHTIEKKTNESTETITSSHGWIFGCDICQDVCPWNHNPIPTNEPAFLPNSFILSATYDDWENLSESQFETYFAGSPLRRAGYKKIKENLKATKL